MLLHKESKGILVRFPCGDIFGNFQNVAAARILYCTVLHTGLGLPDFRRAELLQVRTGDFRLAVDLLESQGYSY
jgi:hypothetical protein